MGLQNKFVSFLNNHFFGGCTRKYKQKLQVYGVLVDYTNVPTEDALSFDLSRIGFVRVSEDHYKRCIVLTLEDKKSELELFLNHSRIRSRYTFKYTLTFTELDKKMLSHDEYRLVNDICSSGFIEI